MKNVLIHTSTKEILDSSEDDFSYIPGIGEKYSVVSVSNAKAETFESATDSVYLVDNQVISFEANKNRLKEEYRNQRFTDNVDLFKANKISKIKAARDTEYKSTLTTTDGLQFKADLETIIDVKSIIETLADGESFSNYKLADGSYSNITKTQFQTAIREGIERKIAAFAKEAELATEISAATTRTELDAITW